MEIFEPYFKPEVRRSGAGFVAQGKVSLSQPSDTEIQSYVKASSAFKVTFKSTSVESREMTADCTCPHSKKGQFCKHMWAALLVINEKKNDFLQGKTELSKASPTIDVQAPYREKQSDYRKLQYQKQKLRLNQIKLAKKNGPVIQDDSYPPFIEAALKYFSLNGFELRNSMTKESVSLAMKKLARVFHPDMGGTHEEFTELNRNMNVLLKFCPQE
jgi:uncharacterized Zn finger protein